MADLEKIREYTTAVISGDFMTLFKDVEIPQLPQAVALLIEEFSKQDPDIERLTQIISSEVELSAKIMRTVNSALYGVANPVKSIHSAIMLLGLKSIRTMALSYTMKASMPKPRSGIFDQEAFWTDSLLQALLARALAHQYIPGEEDEAFTPIFLSHMSLPVLLCAWRNYYFPVIDQWKMTNMRLSFKEREDFGWDHAQAGAWILQSWGFPEEIVSLVGAHNLTIEEIHELGIEQTVALPIATASMLPSVLRPNDEESEELIEAVTENISMSRKEFGSLLQDVQAKFDDIRDLFGLNDQNAGSMLEGIIHLCDPKLAENSA
ncbi:MAG: HDOD domain-containing protein [Planctomycetota bacterium]|jgi:HD-like signal output (HDOD) protein